MKGFDRWYAPKQAQMRADQLLRFIHNARIDDFHKGRHRLRFPGTYVQYFNTSQAGPPPSPDASLAFGSEGPFWIVGRGTLSERRIPVTRGGTWSVGVTVDEPPAAHLGTRLQNRDPIAICETALDYLRNLVHEAKVQFPAMQ